jgi:hypothetical protein
MQYYLIALLVLTPFISSACGGISSWYELLPVTMLLTIPFALLFFLVFRLIPKFKIKGIRWAVIRSLIFFIAFSFFVGWVVFNLSASSLCLEGSLPLPK